MSYLETICTEYSKILGPVAKFLGIAQSFQEFNKLLKRSVVKKA